MLSLETFLAVSNLVSPSPNQTLSNVSSPLMDYLDISTTALKNTGYV